MSKPLIIIAYAPASVPCLTAILTISTRRGCGVFYIIATFTRRVLMWLAIQYVLIRIFFFPVANRLLKFSRDRENSFNIYILFSIFI